MTANEQYIHCEVCGHSKIIECTGGINIMSCHYGEYKNHPVWGDFECPLGDKKPVRKLEETNWW